MSKPNIVFILCDDLGWMDLGCQGSTFYETPNIDRLAAKGMTFTDAYASAPDCSATRASTITGKYPARLGLTKYLGGHAVGALCDVPFFQQLPAQEYNLARALKERGGYQTWHVGKWHLGEPGALPHEVGFDVNIGGNVRGMPHLPDGFFAPWNLDFMPEGEPGDYLTDRETEEAVTLIESAGDQPFFLNYWPYAVHVPIQAPQSLLEKYQQKARDLGLDQPYPFEEGEKFPFLRKREDHVQRRKLQSDPVYAAMIENLDTNVGKLLAALERSGKAADTLIVFTSDNGGLATAEDSPTCNLPLAEGKGWLYEGGVRVPLLVSWPGVTAAGSTCHEITTTPDVYPTFLEAAGIPPISTQHEDGASLLPALRGEPLERGPIFWHYPHYSNQGGPPSSSIREGDWKLIQFFEDQRIELYHLRDDIGEENEIAAERPDIADQLQDRLAAWRESVGALMPQRNPHWPDGPA